MKHNLFRPHDFKEGQHAVVGDCNGFTMQERWEVETPIFADAILSKLNGTLILDYGCGVGRLAKCILDKTNSVEVVGLDASAEMLFQANSYVNNSRFATCLPLELTNKNFGKFDLVYCVYVLQHCPAIELRDVLARIHYNLKDDGYFIYCSSDYRMAIRYDNGGFFDDRFLGINLQEEISRFFVCEGNLFSQEILDKNPLVKNMVQGYLPHPALVFKKKEITNYFDAAAGSNFQIQTTEIKKEVVQVAQKQDVTDIKKIVLINRLSPGDILVMTNAIRDLHKAYPNQYQTNVCTPCDTIFENNPYISRFQFDNDKYNAVHKKSLEKSGYYEIVDDIMFIDMQYPMIHKSGEVGSHFSEGHRDFLASVLKKEIPQTSLCPEIYLNQTEKDWVSPVTVKCGHNKKYWVINAGNKGDFTLKQYPYYQEVVTKLKDKITFVQIGEATHDHKVLDGVINMVGKTNARELFRLIYKAEGVLTCVSFPMHIAAAFRKPCVVVSGAREGTRWELYPNQQFLYVNGCLPCATYDGCWRSKHSECDNKVNDIPRCMTLITPDDVVRAVTRYYDGQILTY